MRLRYAAACIACVAASTGYARFRRGPEEGRFMVDFMLGLAFVAMVLTPAIVASVQRSRSHDGEI